MAYSGVTRIESDYNRGSAVLIDDRWLLTSAHVVATLPANAWEVIFERGWFDSDRSVSQIITHPEYNSSTFEADLALIKLSSNAPSDTTQYSLAFDKIPLGSTLNFQGYGERVATESFGFWTGVPLLQSSYNTLDAYSDDLGISSDAFSFAFDYDDGSASNDSLGWNFGFHHSGIGNAEGFIGPGDSGGAAFYDGKLAGIISHIFDYSGDTRIDGSLGEVGHAQSLAYYAEWIADYVPSIESSIPEPEPEPIWRPGQLFSASKEQVESLALLYEAGLGRRPDEPGLNYWIDRYEDGTLLDEVANGFLYSNEFGGYPEHQSSFISKLYNNVLDRAPDLSGYEYWSNEMAQGLNYAEVLVRFSESSENRQQSESWLETLHQGAGNDWFLG